MVDINWGILGNQVDPGNAFLQGVERGKQRREEQITKNALAQVATNWPGAGGGNSLAADTKADEQKFNELLAPLAQINPMMAIQLRQKRAEEMDRMAGIQQDQRKARQDSIVTMGRLLDNSTDEASYQQSLAAARQLGMDVSGAPQQFDPNWVAQQKMIVGVFSKDGGQQISGIARELQDAGYTPGTPEFAMAMRGVINNKYASEYVDEQGNTRRRSALNLGGAPSPTPSASPAPIAYQGPHMTPAQAQSIGQGTNFLAWQKRTGTPVLVNGPEDAAGLPPGTLMVTTDGRTGVKR